MAPSSFLFSSPWEMARSHTHNYLCWTQVTAAAATVGLVWLGIYSRKDEWRPSTHAHKSGAHFQTTMGCLLLVCTYIMGTAHNFPFFSSSSPSFLVGCSQSRLLSWGEIMREAEGGEERERGGGMNEEHRVAFSSAAAAAAAD